MAKAPEPAVTPAEIVFELEQFERSDDRLTLSGRWFGVRGRRFVRPTLTLAVDGERIRALAHLDHKPWAAEDGQPWTASFPSRKPGRVADSELSVAPDITIQLPPPSGRRSRSQRLSAVPRRDAMTASWGELAAIIEAPRDFEAEAPEFEAEAPSAPGTAVAEAPEAPEAPDAREAPEAPEATVEGLRMEMEGLLAQLAEAQNALTTATAERDSASAEVESAKADVKSARTEVSSLRAELDELRRQLGRRDGESETVQAELAAVRAGREAALRSAAQAEAEREDALTQAAHAEAERDALSTERTELASALEQSQSTVERLNREHDDAVTSRGAALVMRGATQALPAYERHVGWSRRALVVVVLVGIVFAVLIVLGAL